MSSADSADVDRPTATDFVRELVQRDIEEGRYGGRGRTRFPPEPNGYLHIGHAKAISLDYELAAEFGGVCNLRFDDTNPDTEDASYVDGIIADIRWLGYEPGGAAVRERLLRAAVRVGRAPDRGPEGVRRRPGRRHDPRPAGRL